MVHGRERVRQHAQQVALSQRQFGVLGASSGLLAALGCELVSALLYHFVFDLRWQPHPWLLALPLIGALLVGLAYFLREVHLATQTVRITLKRPH